MDNDKYWQLKMNAVMDQAKGAYENAKNSIESLTQYEEGLNLLAFPFLEELWGNSMRTITLAGTRDRAEVHQKSQCYYSGWGHSFDGNFHNLLGTSNQTYLDFLIFFCGHELRDDGEPTIVLCVNDDYLYRTFYNKPEHIGFKNKLIEAGERQGTPYCQKFEILPTLKKIMNVLPDREYLDKIAVHHNDLETAYKEGLLGKNWFSPQIVLNCDVSYGSVRAFHYITEDHMDALMSDAVYRAYLDFFKQVEGLKEFFLRFSQDVREGNEIAKDILASRNFDQMSFHNLYPPAFYRTIMSCWQNHKYEIATLIESMASYPDMNFDIQIEQLALELYFTRLYEGNSRVNFITNEEFIKSVTDKPFYGRDHYKELFRKLLVIGDDPRDYFFTFSFENCHFQETSPIDTNLFLKGNDISVGELALKRLMYEASHHYKLKTTFDSLSIS